MRRDLFGILLLCLALLLPAVQGLACDDTILVLVTGVNPSDRFAGKLLEMTSLLRLLADDLKAFNHLAAGEKLSRLMQAWLDFDNGLTQNLHSLTGDAEEMKRWMHGVADRIGVVRRHHKDQRFVEAHDLVETLVVQLSLLSARMYGNTLMKDFLQTEASLYELKSDWRGLTGATVAGRLQQISGNLASLSASLSILELRVKADSLASAGEILAASVRALEKPVPQNLLRFNRMLEEFYLFREAFYRQPGLLRNR